MTGDELQIFVKGTEVIFRHVEDNIFEFPSGRKLNSKQIDSLLELESMLMDLELVLCD